ncbi:MAG: hypothetical protein U9P36_07510 [Thermodesulfobacteriota bacterium]|nr:hypothetical protein [Thermodesulfobacteriota bacterium]
MNKYEALLNSYGAVVFYLAAPLCGATEFLQRSQEAVPAPYGVT